jgi:hypothetical protein
MKFLVPGTMCVMKKGASAGDFYRSIWPTTFDRLEERPRGELWPDERVLIIACEKRVRQSWPTRCNYWFLVLRSEDNVLGWVRFSDADVDFWLEEV